MNGKVRSRRGGAIVLGLIAVALAPIRPKPAAGIVVGKPRKMQSWIARGLIIFVGSGLTAVSEVGAAQEREVIIAGKEIVERLTRLEEGQKQLAQRIDKLEATLNRRIDEVQTGLRLRIDEVQTGLRQRIDEVQTGLRLRIDEVQTGLGQRIDEFQTGLGQRIDDLRQVVLWGFGVTFAGMFALVGFVIWDRRTALAPAVHRIEDLQSRQQKIEEALRQLSKENPKLAETLRNLGLL